MNSDPHAIRQRQRDAARQLGELLKPDLPPLYWDLAPFVAADVLTGQASGETDDSTRAVVAEWAAYFGGEVTETRADGCPHTTVQTTLVLDGGLQVKVWGAVERKEKP